MSLKDKEEAKVYLQVLLLEVKSVIQNLEGGSSRRVAVVNESD